MNGGLLTTPPAEAKTAAEKQAFSTSFITMATVEEKPVDWLIDGYMPRGAITVLSADGGSGKTFCLCNILAGLSTGQRTIFEEDYLDPPQRQPGNVIFFSGEDSLSHVLKGRLRHAGADMEKVVTVSPSDSLFKSICFGSEALEWAVQEYKPLLVAFDPLQAFVTPGTDMSRRSEMRAQFMSLLTLAERYGTAFLILCHTNKRQNADGRNRAADSSDLWDVARSFLMSGKEGNTFHYSQEKNSYAELQPTVLAHIENKRLVFEGVTDKRDREYMQEKPTAAKSGGESLAAAQELIVEYLREVKRATGKELNEACLADGKKQHTIDRARKGLRDLGIIEKVIEPLRDKKGNQVYWQLVNDALIPWE